MTWQAYSQHGTCDLCTWQPYAALGLSSHANLEVMSSRAVLNALQHAPQVQNEALKAACPVPFDEGRMWKSEDGEALKTQLQLHFRNMTKAMDCVGCEKCKLWGKLQLLGQPSPHTTH